MAAMLAALVVVAGCASTGMSSEQTVGTTGTTGTTATVPDRPEQVNTSEPGTLPVGQELDVRLQTTLSSSTATAEERFDATTVVDLKQGNTVLVPAGSSVRGVVRSVKEAGNIDRTGSLTLAFDQITIRGRDYPIKGMATQVFKSGGIREEVGTVGAAAGVGAIVGGIIGGLQGAVIGAAVGTGGVIAATEGKDVELPAGSIIRIRMDSPLHMR
jgi:hypothetical protein